jgi:hypothetical protein
VFLSGSVFQGNFGDEDDRFASNTHKRATPNGGRRITGQPNEH